MVRGKKAIGGQPLITGFGRDLSQLKFKRTSTCTGGLDDQEVNDLNTEIANLKIVRNLLMNELSNERTIDVRFIPAKDDPNIGFVNPPGSKFNRDDFGHGQSTYDSYAGRDKTMTALWLNQLNTNNDQLNTNKALEADLDNIALSFDVVSSFDGIIGAVRVLNDGNRLKNDSDYIIPPITGKTVKFLSGIQAKGAWDSMSLYTHMYEGSVDATTNIQQILFFKTPEPTGMWRSVSFDYNTGTGVINNVITHYLDSQQGIGPSPSAEEIEDTAKKLLAITGQGYANIEDNTPWGLTAVTYKYMNKLN